MNISIIGTGYVGLVTGVCLAELGHKVTCVDEDKIKVKLIADGKSPIYEKGLEKLIKKNIDNNLLVTTDLHEAFLKTDVTFLAVGTPFKNNQINLSFIEKAAQQIGQSLKFKKKFHIIVVKSTVVPGTTDKISKIIEKTSKKKCNKNFSIAMNPEFLREGEAVNDFMHPDRIVIGTDDKKTKKQLNQLYSCFKNVDILNTNMVTAELIKYTANSFFASCISFSNEISNLSRAIGNIDSKEVMYGLHLDKRLSPKDSNGKRINTGILSYLDGGCGYGGSCFPKDLKAINAFAKNNNFNMQLLKSVININNTQIEQINSILIEEFGSLKNLELSILGLSFKPGTSDIRESASINLINNLLKKKCLVSTYDPTAIENTKSIFKDKIKYYNSLKKCLFDSKVIIIMTAWDEFRNIPKLLNSLKRNPIVIDGRRILDPSKILHYRGIGYSKK